jgi:hypothetical protein
MSSTKIFVANYILSSSFEAEQDDPSVRHGTMEDEASPQFAAVSRYREQAIAEAMRLCEAELAEDNDPEHGPKWRWVVTAEGAEGIATLPGEDEHEDEAVVDEAVVVVREAVLS